MRGGGGVTHKMLLCFIVRNLFKDKINISNNIDNTTVLKGKLPYGGRPRVLYVIVK